jgi:Ran GTPase-activating protein (RanGAP) involved in mRNA processing and transport
LEDIVLKIYDIASKYKISIERFSNKDNDENKKEDKDNKKENNIFQFGKTIANLFSSQSSKKKKSESNENDQSSNLSKDDFSFELTNKITSEISENNILYNLIKAQRPTKPVIQELFNNFKQKFEKFFDFEFLNISNKNTKYYEIVNIKLEDYLNKEIKSVLIENLKNYNLNSKNKISILVDKISQNIQNGVLLNSINKTALYNFKYFDKEYSELNFILRNSQNQIIDEKSIGFDGPENAIQKNSISEVLQIDNNQITKISDILGFSSSKNIKNTLIINLSDVEKILSQRHTFDYFSFLIKSQNSDIKKIIIKGDIKKNISLRSFYNLFLNILLYNRNIITLKFTDIYLSSDTQTRENDSLRRLSIYKEPVNQSLQELVNFINYSSNIMFLNISNCFMGDEGLKFLCKNFTNYNLVVLNLTKNHLKENSGFFLADFIPKLNNLESLILADNSITDPGFTSLATSISLMTQGSLSNLDLSNNSIKETESRTFVDYLQKYQNLKEMNLSGNTFVSAAANCIGIYLKLVNGLVKIDLSKCELNDESCPLLIKNLDNSSVENIIFDSNPLGQVGAILLANMLRMNKYIRSISLNNCGITGIGITLLAKNCENNTILKEIDLRNNKINNEEFKIITKLLEGKSYSFLLDEVETIK